MICYLTSAEAEVPERDVFPQTSFTDIRDPSLKLAEFKLENIISTLQMYTDDSIFSSFSLKNCILDDKRPHIKKATPR